MFKLYKGFFKMNSSVVVVNESAHVSCKQDCDRIWFRIGLQLIIIYY